MLAVSNQAIHCAWRAGEFLFAPLRRSDTSKRSGSRRNLGTGLFTVRQIARAHGGGVSAESADGRISFVIQLPKRAP